METPLPGLTRRRLLTGFSLILGAGAVAGCSYEPYDRGSAAPSDNLTMAPPAPRTETIPPAPSEAVVWNPGHWEWAGTRYVWVSGHYIQRPTAQANWVPGRWVKRDGDWYWVEGHWAS